MRYECCYILVSVLSLKTGPSFSCIPWCWCVTTYSWNDPGNPELSLSCILLFLCCEAALLVLGEIKHVLNILTKIVVYLADQRWPHINTSFLFWLLPEYPSRFLSSFMTNAIRQVCPAHPPVCSMVPCSQRHSSCASACLICQVSFHPHQHFPACMFHQLRW